MTLTKDASQDRVGPYRILEELGHGGMGVVYLAEQLEPVRRRVALKLIKMGMDTREVIARFEAERQVLALLDHPSIAKVLGAGTTEAGRPYFVMELVRGIPITEYCDTHKLSIRERVDLFIPVCLAVQHAHQKGIIHRDIKPSNILITLQDQGPTPKVIDFGIAKAVAGNLTDRTLHTGLGLTLGTLGYMSPEQADASGLDIDTRTDIYSLGVVLYELLVGVLPYEVTSLGHAELLAKYILQDVEAPKLASRLRSLPVAQAAMVAAFRRTHRAALAQQVRGDLQWIVGKAIEKDRSRRYDTANGFGLDLRRHLEDEPVVARPPSSSYRLRKFARRHRAGVAAAAATVIAMVAGLALATLGFVEAKRAEQVAASEAAAAHEVSEFLVGLFRTSAPDQARGNTVTARELLDRGAEQIRDELSDQPLTQARLMHTMGAAYRSLGLYDVALPLLTESHDARQRLLGPDHSETLETRYELAWAHQDLGRMVPAESLFAAVLAARERRGEVAELATGQTLAGLALVRLRLGRYEEAEQLFQRARTILEPQPSAQLDVAYVLSSLAILHQQRKQHRESAGLLERAIEIRRRLLPPDHPVVANAANNLATSYYHLERLDEAATLYAEAMGIWTKTLGPEHQNVAGGLTNLGLLAHKRQRYAEAESLLLRGQAIAHKALDPGHPLIAVNAQALGKVYMDTRRDRLAADAFARVLAIREALLGRDHPDLAETLELYGPVLQRMGREREAAAVEVRLARMNPAAGSRR